MAFKLGSSASAWLAFVVMSWAGACDAGGTQKSPRPEPKAEADEANASGKRLEELQRQLQTIFQSQTKPQASEENSAVQRLEKILKQLQGPADQISLKDIAKELGIAVTQLRAVTPAPARKPVIQVLPQPAIQGPGSGWGGPGSAPWMPGMPGTNIGGGLIRIEMFEGKNLEPKRDDPKTQQARAEVAEAEKRLAEARAKLTKIQEASRLVPQQRPTREPDLATIEQRLEQLSRELEAMRQVLKKHRP